MDKWRIIDNKNIADLHVKVFGKDKKDLLQNILLAFTSLTTDIRKLKEINKLKNLEIKEKSFKELVFNLVEELIYLKDTKGLLFKKGKFFFNRNNKVSLTAVLFGEKISEKLPIKIDIKAITRHKFEVKKEKDIFKATMVFDI